jgi:hypothetical protein
MKTSTFQRGLLLGAALLVGMPLSASAKCAVRGPDGRLLAVSQPLVVIDGRQASQSELDALTLNRLSVYGSIHAMPMVCWNPADSTYNQSGWGVTVTQVVTRPFMDRLVAGLEKVASAQQSFFATRGMYSSRLEELGIGDDQFDEVSIELVTSPTGWSAIATKGLMVHRCLVRLDTVTACHIWVDPSRKHALSLEG